MTGIQDVYIYEVFKHVLIQRNKDEALQAVAYMFQGKVLELDTSIALEAAKISIDLKLPMDDSIILATTRTLSAVLWTQDAAVVLEIGHPGQDCPVIVNGQQTCTIDRPAEPGRWHCQKIKIFYTP